ncbi:MAG: long-chain fatty acid--CoA ligase [Bacteroidia bacterium]|nr:long-chain fatty acid--CoA ligase [Bacteroidia bacterium]
MEVTRTFDLIDHINNKYPKSDILAGKVNGEWKKYSTQDYRCYSNYISYALLELGFKKDDKIITVTHNQPEWNFIDFGMAQIGVVHVPVYPNISEEDYTHIFNHCDATAVFVSDKVLLNRIENSINAAPKIKNVFCIAECEGLMSFSELIEIGKQNAEKHKKKLESIRDNIKENDLVTIIYTSGTTGLSKGVMLSHKNLVVNAISSSKIQPLNHNHRFLSFLPLCHVYERMINYHYQYLGISIYYAENLGTIAINLREINAHGMCSVPRVLENIFDKLNTVGKDLTGIKKKIFFWALKLALKYEVDGKNGWLYSQKLKIADKLVYNKWRASLGGNLQLIISGGSAIQIRLLRLFWAIGIQAIEGYGLTETSPVLSCNLPRKGGVKFGTVGQILEKIEVKIADDGEIISRGPCIMLGYYKDEEATKSVIDEDGWFHTGDIGNIDDEGFLKITDRKKEIFKNSGGKYVAPQLIENKCKESNFIEQVFIVGENEKYTAAVISPNFNHLHFWATKHKQHFRDNQDLILNTKVLDRIHKEIVCVNQKLSPHEQIKKFRLTADEWTPQTGELSPTLKLRRKVLFKKYDHYVKEMFL